MTARTLMVQGTASSVGKSLLVAGLCRLFRDRGLRVAPFKSQNMALNSSVTPDGCEIGRAQAVQAEAAGIAPCADMNPILLKPEGEARSQVVVLGRPIGSMGAVEYHAHKPALRTVVAESLARLRARVDLVVIEGAGSPAEINLKDRDLVNMHVARIADAPVLLVGDIDRGGVFAALVGTMILLEPDERDRVAGFVINKFRGDPALLAPGLDMLTARTGVPVLGVVPHVPRLRIADEDSLSLDGDRLRRRPRPGELDIAVVRLPRIANHDDLEPLEHEPGVAVRFVDHPAALAGADLAVVPGSKSTAADLAWLRASGLAAALSARAGRGEPILGICGGCQMLGGAIDDPDAVESDTPHVDGLGLLPLATRFGRDKRTAQVRARAARPSLLADRAGAPLAGYEIHMGRTRRTDGAAPLFTIDSRNGAPATAADDLDRAQTTADGASSPDGAVLGTMLHGILDDDAVRSTLLRHLRTRRGLATPDAPPIPGRDAEYSRLAGVIASSLDLERICRIAGLPWPLPR